MRYVKNLEFGKEETEKTEKQKEKESKRKEKGIKWRLLLPEG